MKICPVVMAGGNGTRLWPLSRAGFPKQFIALNDTESLFQKACQRLSGIQQSGFRVTPPVVVTNEQHRFLAAQQLAEMALSGSSIILEPEGRNTAPAMTLAALKATDHADAILFVTPADQTIEDTAAFNRAAQQAVQLAADGTLVVLGVVPDKPHTGYGYIQANLDNGKVKQFIEKPSSDKAQEYLGSGGYFWNAGMFVVKASVWLSMLEKYRPDIMAASLAAWQVRQTDQSFIRPGESEFLAIPAESVDYAVIEQLPGSGFGIKMVPLDAGWNDLGSWDAVWDTASVDTDGNAFAGDVISFDTHHCYAHAAQRMVSLVGVDNLVVVETPDAVLVTNKADSQKVKQVVEQLNAQHRAESVLHRKVMRPWGWYDSLDEGERFKVKRIQVAPGASLSLQKHYHRAEHWVVVKGTAEVTCGEQVSILTENQSTYIPLGEVHRLSNPGETPLEIIEVQSGSYLGEDDIVRYEDKYGR